MIVGKNLRDKALMDKLEEMVSGKKKESVAMPAMGMQNKDIGDESDFILFMYIDAGDGECVCPNDKG